MKVHSGLGRTPASFSKSRELRYIIEALSLTSLWAGTALSLVILAVLFSGQALDTPNLPSERRLFMGGLDHQRDLKLMINEFWEACHGTECQLEKSLRTAEGEKNDSNKI